MPKLLVPDVLPPGVTPKALDSVKELVKGGRRSFGVPGASLSWGFDAAASSDLTAGMEGEKQIAKILDTFVNDPGYPHALVFHSVRWPGSEGDTDHMLLIGDQVMLIDAKRWKSKRKYSVTDKGSVMRGTVAFPEGNVKMLPAMSTWRKVLGARVHGVVAIAQEEIFVPYDANWQKAPYKLVTAEKLPEFLDRYYNRDIAKKNQDVVNLTLASIIAVGLVKPRDRRGEVINTKALNMMKRS